MRTLRSSWPLVAAASLVGSLLLAACSGGTGPSASPSSPPTSPPASESPSATPAIPTPTVAPTPTPAPTPTEAAFACPLAVTALEVPSNRLVGIAVASMTSFDRITFTFGDDGQGSGATPTVDVATVRPPFMKSPSGFPLEVAGDAFYRVTFRETIVADENGDSTLVGSTDLRPTGPAIRQVVEAEAFEGVVDWLVGTAAVGTTDACARISVDPAARTVVVDVQAP